MAGWYTLTCFHCTKFVSGAISRVFLFKDCEDLHFDCEKTDEKNLLDST